MPKQDLRAKAIAQGSQFRTSGALVVAYRDAKGRFFNARVLGAGTSSGLKLKYGNTIVDNVPVMTTVKSVGAYHGRL